MGQGENIRYVRVLEQVKRVIMEYILLLSILKEYMEKFYYIFMGTRDIDKFILSPAHALYAVRLSASVDDVANQLGWNNTNLIYKYHGVIDKLLYSANSYTEVFFDRLLDE